MRRAHRRKTGRTSPTRKDRLRYPKDEQAQEDDASSDDSRARGPGCLNGHVARLSNSTPITRRRPYLNTTVLRKTTADSAAGQLLVQLGPIGHNVANAARFT